MSLSFACFSFVFLLSICDNSFFFFVILFIFECAGTLLLCGLSLVVGSGGYSLVEAQELCYTGLVALRHVGSSRIRDQTRSPALTGRFFTTEPPGKPQFVRALYLGQLLTLSLSNVNIFPLHSLFP